VGALGAAAEQALPTIRARCAEALAHQRAGSFASRCSRAGRMRTPSRPRCRQCLAPVAGAAVTASQCARSGRLIRGRTTGWWRRVRPR